MSKNSNDKNIFDWKAFRGKIWKWLKKHWWKIVLVTLLIALPSLELIYLKDTGQLNLDTGHKIIIMIRDALTGIGALYVILQARQWIREIKGRDRYEIAKKLSFLVLEVSEMINDAYRKTPIMEVSDSYRKSIADKKEMFFDLNGKYPTFEEEMALEDEATYKISLSVIRLKINAIDLLLIECKILNIDIESEIKDAIHMPRFRLSLGVRYLYNSDYSLDEEAKNISREILGNRDEYEEVVDSYLKEMNKIVQASIEKLATYME